MSTAASSEYATLTRLPQHEEYTDYSCSTSVERLTRDVESWLRKWHVDQGADRHVSLQSLPQERREHSLHQSSIHSSSSSSTKETSSMTISSENNSNRSTKDLKMPPKSNSNEQSTRGPDPNATSSMPRILRSATIHWVLSFYLRNGESKISAEFELELILWDGPVHTESAPAFTSELPLSVLQLMSTPGSAESHKHCGIFDNFSSVFGIGQHITLTPRQNSTKPTVVKSDSNDVDGKQSSTVSKSIQDNPELWEQYLLQSVYSRHDRLQTAPSSVSYVLTQWLQTAMNLAANMTECCLPVFGWWGELMQQTQSAPQRGSDDPPMLDLKFPAWLNDSVAVRQLADIRRNRRRTTPKEKGIRARFTRPDTSHINLLHVPPLVAGQCHSMDESTRISFWLGLLQHRAPSASRARLAAWGDLLLRYCTQPGDTISLLEARHVFSWTKPQKKQRRIKIFDNDDDGEDSGEQLYEAPPTPTSPRRQARAVAWRKPVSVDLTRTTPTKVQLPPYQRECHQTILGLVTTASGASQDDPLWGPVGDPIDSIWASLSWSSTNKVQHGTPSSQPLLSLPLKIRSSQSMSQDDWREAEEAIESSILNPSSALDFVLKVDCDKEVVQTPLAAMQHCLLAALIRTSTLPSETLLNHLTDAAIMDRWDTAAGNVIAMNLGERAHVGSTTMTLIKAMDWDYAIEDMIEPWQALEVCRNILDTTVQVDSPPEDNLDELLEEANNNPLLQPLAKAAPFGRLLSVLGSYISRVRSPSSMVQVFSTFVQELRRRWDFRESLPNMQYLPGVDPTRTSSHGEKTMSLQQRRNAVGGVVGTIKATNAAYLHSTTEPEPDELHCLIGQKFQVFNLCLETVISEELREVAKLEKRPRLLQSQLESTSENNSVEGGSLPLPPNGPGGANESSLRIVNPPIAEDSFDDMNSVVTFETRAGKNLIPNHPKQDLNDSRSVVTFDTKSLVFSGDNGNNNGVKSVATKPGGSVTSYYTDARMDLTDTKSVGTRSVRSQYFDAGGMSVGTRSVRSQYFDAGGMSVGTRSVRSQYFDAGGMSVGTRSVRSQYFDTGGMSVATRSVRSQYHDTAEEKAAGWETTRKGARCPVQGQLLSNGDQVFAPYLQRPLPLTDDVVQQRKQLVQISHTMSEEEVLERLEVAHRIQRPKLFSDMSSFKAANPGSTLTDFCVWYGNPANPLDEHGAEAKEQSGTSKRGDLGKATRSIRLIELTRDFWSKTWTEAPSVPAAEQDLLFSASNTVEIALDYLETLHPASLISSVMAANLSNAYFALVISAGDSASIPIVNASLTRLRRKIEIALNLLSQDTTRSATPSSSARASGPTMPGAATTLYSYASLETIGACETACVVVGEMEILLSNAVSLLNKLPNQIDLVEELLRCLHGGRSEATTLVKDGARLAVLDALVAQKDRHPVIREYLFRNTDLNHPCQLTVRCGGDNHRDSQNADEDDDRKFSGLLLGLTRTESI